MSQNRGLAQTLNQIGVEMYTWLLSLSVDTFASWRARPEADFVQDIVVAKGKDLVVEVSTRSRGIACKRSWRKMTLTGRHVVTCNGKHAASVTVTATIAADGMATGPATPISAESGATTLPMPTKAPSSYSFSRYHRITHFNSH